MQVECWQDGLFSQLNQNRQHMRMDNIHNKLIIDGDNMNRYFAGGDGLFSQ